MLFSPLFALESLVNNVLRCYNLDSLSWETASFFTWCIFDWALLMTSIQPMKIKYIYGDGPWSWLAFFDQSELSASGNLMSPLTNFKRNWCLVDFLRSNYFWLSIIGCYYYSQSELSVSEVKP